MGTIITYDANEKELRTILSMQKEIIAYKTDDAWTVKGFADKEKFAEYLHTLKRADIALLDITQKDNISLAVQTRKCVGDTLMLIISDDSISPVHYMRPDIMAAALLLRPIRESDARHAISELINTCLYSKDGQNFTIKNKEGSYQVSYASIIAFEAREKKVFLRTESEEIGFYDTLEKLSERLSERFIRVHKGFLVNATRIQKVMFSENLIYMDDGAMIPISRTYKREVREKLK